MAKRLQPARIVTADGLDLSNYVTEINVPLDGRGLVEVTAKFVGVELDVDPDTRLITVTVGQKTTKPEPDGA